MNTHTSTASTQPAPSPATVDQYIAQAHQMRAEYIATSVKSGLATLRGLFSHKPIAAKTAAKLSSAH
ncbi:hypothetical protein CLV80_101384 [Yoonia maritima]|uniref:Phasin protein n=1 Tax=Yoonia maritima TaxID=1435347 RepID=A0A2T0W4X3_9RHOB|nr:hypothetical protein [Yoonia maritima]PRY80529.1 hypothetical protein CLV80_101384 [Yoonia maritima]